MKNHPSFATRMTHSVAPSTCLNKASKAGLILKEFETFSLEKHIIFSENKVTYTSLVDQNLLKLFKVKLQRCWIHYSSESTVQKSKIVGR